MVLRAIDLTDVNCDLGIGDPAWTILTQRLSSRVPRRVVVWTGVMCEWVGVYMLVMHMIDAL